MVAGCSFLGLSEKGAMMLPWRRATVRTDVEGEVNAVAGSRAAKEATAAKTLLILMAFLVV
jgi:hypothetical protein